MITLTRGEFQNGFDVLGLKQRIVRENLLTRGPRRQKIQHILHANAERSDARPPTALLRIDGDAMQFTHNCALPVPVEIGSHYNWFSFISTRSPHPQARTARITPSADRNVGKLQRNKLVCAYKRPFCNNFRLWKTIAKCGSQCYIPSCL